MIGENLNDGNRLSSKEIKGLVDKGFVIDNNRDFTAVLPSERDSSNDKNYRLNFVGFTTNNEGEMKTVFPKNYKWSKNIDIDRKKTFRTITKHIQKNPSMYIGSEFEKNIDTNYPFSAFFSIYEYYEKYGIHFEEQHRIRPYGSGKVNWKETIRLSQKYIVNGKLIMIPVYHNVRRRSDTFLSNCMVYAIDYTIDQFSAFIDKDKTNRPFPEFDFLSHREFVLKNLHEIKNSTYSDIQIKLIDGFIEYFYKFSSNKSSKFYLKHYSYANIWEEMVMEYLKSHYAGFDNDELKLSISEVIPRNKFYKPIFKPNAANKKQSFQPDHYLTKDDNTQIILDAKYYEPSGMNYKQISYLLFLKNIRDTHNGPKKFSKTHSALIIPSDKRKSSIHFKMNKDYNQECQDFIISEERLNIREIVDFWISH